MTAGERLAPPKWDAFCNSHAGVWVGGIGTYDSKSGDGISSETVELELVEGKTFPISHRFDSFVQKDL